MTFKHAATGIIIGFLAAIGAGTILAAVVTEILRRLK